jgi:spectinomycin phosphotransferase
LREPPVGVSNEALRGSLQSEYGLAVAEIALLPMGHDSSAWVYRVRTTDGISYFLKAFKRLITESSLMVPRLLHDQGITQVIAPIPTIDQTLRTELDSYTLILYPFVDGKSGKDGGMTPSQWIAYGTILRQIHGAALLPDLAPVMRRETFVPEGADLVRELDTAVGRRAFAVPAARTLATFWREQQEKIHTLVQRGEALGQRLATRAPAFVLCHADIHTANVLVGADGQLWIVDWDETVLAPKERDLMFVAGGGINDRLVSPGDEELFFQGYGATTIDVLALAYYRYAWAVSDISAFGTEIFFRTDLGPGAKDAAADEFINLFLPGRIVAKALASPVP